MLCCCADAKAVQELDPRYPKIAGEDSYGEDGSHEGGGHGQAEGAGQLGAGLHGYEHGRLQVQPGPSHRQLEHQHQSEQVVGKLHHLLLFTSILPDDF